MSATARSTCPLVGHSSQATTEAAYRKQLRPVITEGAEAMDDIFAEDQEEEDAEEEGEGDAVARPDSVGPLFGPGHERGPFAIKRMGL
ncbi:hypothetical protein [Streptomyces canus]|uniref:hypothetical protein n=1 Tax=Streptomyces canus TaxID=58343 RepID=UPI003F6C246A